MKEKFKELFINECKKNREYLGFDAKDMANCLDNVSEQDYINFECGTYNMSKENVERIIKVLCVNKPKKFDVNNYIDTSFLNEEEIADLSDVIKSIVGDNDD